MITTTSCSNDPTYLTGRLTSKADVTEHKKRPMGSMLHDSAFFSVFLTNQFIVMKCGSFLYVFRC
jgi:hypothetical protein